MALRTGRSRLPELLGDLSQAEFARRLGVSEAFVSQIINGNGKKKFSYEMAKNAADILGCQMEDLHEWIYVRSGKRT